MGLRNLSIQFQHFVADINDGHTSTGSRVHGPVPATAGRQAEHTAAPNIWTQPARSINGGQGIDEIVLPCPDEDLPCAIDYRATTVVLRVGEPDVGVDGLEPIDDDAPDVDTVLQLLDAWGTDDTTGDLDANGIVDAIDLAFLLGGPTE